MLEKLGRFLLLLVVGFLAVFVLGSAVPAQAAQAVLDDISKPWKGDFEHMLKRRRMRALVVYNKLFYFLDGAKQRGASYEALKNFETYINKKYKLKTRKMHVVFIPVTRDRLLPALEEGLGDIAVANLTGYSEVAELPDKMWGKTFSSHRALTTPI